MKAWKKISRWGMAATLLAAFAISFSACNNVSPLNEEDAFAGKNVQIIDLGDEFMTLSKGYETSAVVTPEEGGNLLLIKGPAFYAEQHNLEEGGDLLITEADSVDVLEFGGASGFIVRLQVLANSVEDTTKLTLQMDNNSFDMRYGPSGMVFSRPALLDIIALNLRLNGVNPETLAIYYDNRETGEWEEMEAKQIIVNEKFGFLRIVDAEIPHFSRYAVAWSE